jgi:predicted phosphodiesterase
VNEREPDLAVIAGDLTDDGYPDQYPLAARELAALACPRIVRVPGNHDARNVGYLRYEDAFGARDSRLRLDCGGTEVALVAVDSSKPDLDEGEIGREHYGWIEEGFAGEADVRIFVCHHHLVPVPGTGRERNQVLDAGDVLSLLRQSAHARVPAPGLQPDQDRRRADLGRALHPRWSPAELGRLSTRLARRALCPSRRSIRTRAARRLTSRRAADTAGSVR